jgi:hypothetical protein
MFLRELIVEDAMMGKIADSGKIIRILKKAHTVPFSDEKNWLLVDMDPAKGNKGLGIKWIPADTRFEWVRPYRDNVEQGVAEGISNSPQTVTRIDSQEIKDFGSNLKNYKHTDDWSQSGIDTGDDSYWQKKNLKTNATKGLFAGDPHRTALYATGNAHETRYVEFTQNGQPIVYFDKKDLPKMRGRKTYLTVFDAVNFRELPTGEYFSENPGTPLKQTEITDPFKYIADQGWIVRVTDDLDKVFKQVKNMHKAGKIAHYGAEGMNESKQGVAENFADGKNPQDKGDSKRHGVPTKASVTTLRKVAKQGGRKGQLAHWMANMKAGKKKSLNEAVIHPGVMAALEDFLPFVMKMLKLDKLPRIGIHKTIETGDQPSFGGYDMENNSIQLALKDRHPADILRTLAHELVHYKQNTTHELDDQSGSTGSPEENEANSKAGVIMRQFNKRFPQYLE